MPVNEFEKKVQQKMDELQLRPSPGVWTEVEKQIRQDKRRRRVIIYWWLLPILLAGGIATYLVINNDVKISESQEQATNYNRQPENTNIPTSQSNPVSTPGNEIDINSNTKNTSPAPNNNLGSITTKTNNQLSVESITAAKKKKANQVHERKQNIDKVVTDASVIQPSFDLTVEKSNVNSNPQTKSNEIVSGNPDVIPLDSNRQTQTENPLTNRPGNIDTLKISQEAVIEKKAEQDLVKHTRKKWRFGIEIKPGVSTTWQGKLFGSSKSELVYANPTNVGSSPGPVLSPGPLAPPVLIESPTSGPSIALELFATKRISRKFDFRIGLQYQYLNSSIKVGEHVSAERQVYNDMSSGVLINSYYRAANPGARDDRYVNHYHLAGLNAGLSWNLINKRKFSLSWENYVSINQLLHTNALLFDENLRSYYQDFDAFRKTQFIVGTGISVPILHRKKFTLSLNPSASYGLTPVLKSGTELNSHFLNYGLGIRFNLTGK